MMNEDIIRTSVYLPRELHSQVKIYAIQNRMTVSSVIRQLMERTLASGERLQAQTTVSLKGSTLPLQEVSQYVSDDGLVHEKYD